MHTKRKNYCDLLNNLKKVSENYYVNDAGIVVNKTGEIIGDFKINILTKFYTIYCYSYIKFLEGIYPNITYTLNKGLINQILSDYSMFNSIIYDFIVEYNMYNEVGTGNLSYYPYEDLACELFSFKYHDILTLYLKTELADELHIEKNNTKIKK